MPRPTKSDCVGVLFILPTLHIVMLVASENYYILAGARINANRHNVIMMKTEKNGGPNYLAAWREHRGMSQEDLAERIDPPTTQGQIAHLESGRSGLTAKWLRKLSAALNVTPGLILDHPPHEIDNDIIDIWAHAGRKERRQILDIAKTILRTGTDE